MTRGLQRERHAPLTEEELDAVTVVFHQFETGLREGTIYTKVRPQNDAWTLKWRFFS
jgi:hypothetical protein